VTATAAQLAKGKFETMAQAIAAESGGTAERIGCATAGRGSKTVWIDLDNSPHVPFFAPIIEEVEKRGYKVLITARDCFQVCALADLHRVSYKRIGRHYGKSKILKVAGSCFRALQLAPTVLRGKPAVALSHGSRSQVLLAKLLGIPSIVICDYEFVKGLKALRPAVMMFPEIIVAGAGAAGRVMTYPGIKEDVYVPQFVPDTQLRADMGLSAADLVVTVRPPANEAHYHRPESEVLLEAVFVRLSDCPDTKILLVPRNERQGQSIRKRWPDLFSSGKMRVLEHAVDGLNLIWNSDLVISGGGTMNREAAALGVPVYSIFRGKLGAVDRYLASAGRLTMLESVSDVHTKMVLARRPRAMEPRNGGGAALEKIVDNVVTIVESKC
jgi:predicted glycosyltransferase